MMIRGEADGLKVDARVPAVAGCANAPHVFHVKPALTMTSL